MQMNPMQLMQEFNKFKASFTGDPQKEVMRMLQSGQITQDQLNKAQLMAKELQQILNIK